MIKQSFFFNVKKELSPLQVYTGYYFYRFFFMKNVYIEDISLKSVAVSIKNFNITYMYIEKKTFWFEANKLAKSNIVNNMQLQALNH